ncbi:MAG: NADPH:quinone reductase [Thermoguttaceae bacterium]|nr:NADPH:quinone reductase [Thermoguttaceae bacterium]MDW8037664.1 NADPH:quinone reductase [Thermoguttaceae bacterium]
MKAAYIERTGPPEVIQYGELPTPTPTGSQVLVQVGAVSVNPIDTYIRSGMVPMPIPKPYIVGCDLAGTVVEVGPEAKQFRPGDRVWGSNQGLLGRQGTFAEYACVEEQWLYPTPTGVSDQTAAAIALVGITAYLGLFHHARIQPGEVLFVHGGSGGVGSCVVQMAKLAGATVITTAGSPEKAEICRQLGADRIIQYKSENVDEALRQFAPQGVDVWWETLREPNLERIVGHLRLGGRVVLMAGREARSVLPIGPFYVKDCSIHGFAMFNASADVQRQAAQQINQWLSEGKLQARIDRLMKLKDTAQAHRLQEENTLGKTGVLAGKIVLEP